MTTAITNTLETQTATGVPPVPPEAHQRADIGGQKVRKVIALDKLKLSPRNVRQKANAANIPELAALILSQGLLQALGVTMDPDDPTGQSYLVEYGGRRLVSLQLLAGQGKIAEDSLIECDVYESNRATEISLAENSGREEMHPADQYKAFADLFEKGKSYDDIAAEFGVSSLTVRRRLKLARVAPELIEKFRQGEISNEQMQALALVDNHEQQVKAWEAADTYANSAYHLRRMLTSSEVAGNSRLAVFVGEHDYTAAGGGLRRDLFAENTNDVFFTDSGLLERLAASKLTAIAESLRVTEGWSWAEPRIENLYVHSEFEVVQPTRRKPKPEEAEAIQAAEKALEEAEGALEAYYDEDDGTGVDREDELSAAVERCEAQLEHLNSALLSYSAAVRKSCGVIVAVSGAGEVVYHKGLKVRGGKQTHATGDDAGAGEAADGAGAQTGDAAEAPKALSDRVVLDLTSHRTAAMQASMLQQPDVALRALVHTLCLSVFRVGYFESALKISISRCDHSLSTNATGYADSKAGQLISAAHADWHSRASEAAGGEYGALDSAKLFAWISEMPTEALMSLMAFCTSQSIDVIAGRDARNKTPAPELALALSLNMVDWWNPTAASYFDNVPKAKAAEAVAEACGTDTATPLDKMKKGEAAKAAEQLLTGKHWLPAILR